MSFEDRVQKRAEERLEACFEGEGDDMFCGCTTCIVREVLSATWDEMVAEARREAAEVEIQLDEMKSKLRLPWRLRLATWWDRRKLTKQQRGMVDEFQREVSREMFFGSDESS